MMVQFLEFLYDSSSVLIPDLIKDLESEKPDLIIYDGGFITIKYLLEVLNSRGKPMKSIEFYPNFVYTTKLMKQIPKNGNFFRFDMKTLIYMVPMFFRQVSFSRSFNISVYNPFGFFFKKTDSTKIVAVFPELHPSINEYDEKLFKFVGQCASEEARPFDLSGDLELKALLDLFPPKQHENAGVSDLKFIFMSLGTVFNQNWFVYETVIQAFKEYDLKHNRLFRLSQLKVLMSVGVAGFEHFNKKIQKGELNLPENILLRPKVPQLEVLKRVDLFITHCGMNSTSEAIKYGVPIVAIPIMGDQYLCSMRTCDELSLGIRFDPMSLKANEVGDAIDKVLSDNKFRNNMQEMSKVSAKYNGAVEGAKIVVDHLNRINVKNVKAQQINMPNSNQVAPL